MNKNIKDLFGTTAYDVNGDKIGDVKEVFVDDNTGQPTFVEVNHGLFGTGSSLVPMRGHDFDGSDLKLAFTKDRIKDAPNFDSDAPLTPDMQKEIYDHFALGEASDKHRYDEDRRDNVRDGEVVDRDVNETERTDNGLGAAGAGAGVAGAGAGAGLAADNDRTEVVDGERADIDRDRTEVVDRDRTDVADRDIADRDVADRDGVRNDGLANDDLANDGEMIRSEEQLNVNKDRVETGEVRLRKYVTEDTETVEVPVTREEVRVERTPIDGTEATNYDGRIGEEDASVTLHEERVNVTKETVPVEKVNLNKETVTDTERVSETLRKEQIDTDGDIEGGLRETDNR